MDEKKERLRRGGLWKNETKDGTVFFSGPYSNDLQLTIWPNKYKKTPKDPDFIMYLSAKIKKEGYEPRKEEAADNIAPFLPNIPF